MDWTRAIDAYCERTDASYWSEPINAVTNMAFIVVALFMWQRTDGFPAGRWLSAVLFALGVGSYLFHTFATPWASVLDVVPIAIFTLSFIFLANRHFWRWPHWLAVLGTLAFVPYTAFVTPIFAGLPFFSVSSVYWGLPLLIAIYGAVLRRTSVASGNGLIFGAGLLTASLVFRSIDETICDSFPIGSHFVWHILNGLMLGWMIEVLRRHKMNEA